MIVAEARGHVIGKTNGLPWHLPADLKHFKDLTTGCAVIMGRKTYDSIFARLGKPLPNRTNIVITRDPDFAAEGVKVAHSPEEALTLAGEAEVFVIGGASIYAKMLPVTGRVYQTRIDAKIEGDAYFPELSDEDWREVGRERHRADERNEYDYEFIVWERVT